MREARRAVLIIMLTAGASSALRVSFSNALRRNAVYGIRVTCNRLHSTQLHSDAPAVQEGASEAAPVAEGQLVVKRQGKLLSPNPLFVPRPYTYLQQLDVRIESLTNLGEGIARVDGWVIMIPHTIPGELVRIKVHRNHNVSTLSIQIHDDACVPSTLASCLVHVANCALRMRVDLIFNKRAHAVQAVTTFVPITRCAGTVTRIIQCLLLTVIALHMLTRPTEILRGDADRSAGSQL
jgi:hypothetical protein